MVTKKDWPEKGDEAEDIVEEVLKDLSKKGKLFSYHRSRKGKELDAEGVDFLVYLNNGLAVPLQVKAAPHFKSHFKKHPAIKFVVVVGNRYDDKGEWYKQVYNHVLEEVSKYINTKNP